MVSVLQIARIGLTVSVALKKKKKKFIVLLASVAGNNAIFGLTKILPRFRDSRK